jgi:hypothetical protein
LYHFKADDINTALENRAQMSSLEKGEGRGNLVFIKLSITDAKLSKKYRIYKMYL